MIQHLLLVILAGWFNHERVITYLQEKNPVLKANGGKDG